MGGNEMGVQSRTLVNKKKQTNSSGFKLRTSAIEWRRQNTQKVDWDQTTENPEYLRAKTLFCFWGKATGVTGWKEMFWEN